MNSVRQNRRIPISILQHSHRTKNIISESKENNVLLFLDQIFMIPDKIITQQSPKAENVKRKLDFSKKVSVRKLGAFGNISNTIINEGSNGTAMSVRTNNTKSFSIHLPKCRPKRLINNCKATNRSFNFDKKVVRKYNGVRITARWMNEKSLNI